MKKAFVFLSVLCVVLIFSCQKDSTFTETETATNVTVEVFRSYSSITVEHFFDLTYASSLIFSPTSTAESRSDDVHPSILAVQDFLFEENEVNPFIERLIDSIGYPAWDAARLFDSDEKTIVLIPYIQEGDQDIDNILYAKTEGDDLYMKFLNRSLLWDIISDSDGTSALLSELESDFLFFDNMYFGIGFTDQQVSDRGGTCTICIGCEIKNGKCVGKENGATCTCASDCMNCRHIEIIDGGGGIGITIFLHPWWFYTEKTIHNTNSNPNVNPNNNGNNGGGSSAPPCEAPYEESNNPNQGGNFNFILDDLFAQLSPEIQNQITGLAGTINISPNSWKWLMRHPEAITAMYNHYQAGGAPTDLQAYFDVVSQNTCVLNTDASFEDILKINELMNDEECPMNSADGGYDLVEMAQLANEYPQIWAKWKCQFRGFSDLFTADCFDAAQLAELLTTYSGSDDKIMNTLSADYSANGINCENTPNIGDYISNLCNQDYSAGCDNAPTAQNVIGNVLSGAAACQSFEELDNGIISSIEASILQDCFNNDAGELNLFVKLAKLLSKVYKAVKAGKDLRKGSTWKDIVFDVFDKLMVLSDGTVTPDEVIEALLDLGLGINYDNIKWIKNVLGFASDVKKLTGSALANAFGLMRDGGAHAMRHLSGKAGMSHFTEKQLLRNPELLKKVQKEFYERVSPILENPTKAVPWSQGNYNSTAYLGYLDGEPIVVIVADSVKPGSTGNPSLVGSILTALTSPKLSESQLAYILSQN